MEWPDADPHRCPLFDPAEGWSLYPGSILRLFTLSEAHESMTILPEFPGAHIGYLPYRRLANQKYALKGIDSMQLMLRIFE